MAHLLGLFTASTLLSAVYSVSLNINCNRGQTDYIPEGDTLRCDCNATFTPRARSVQQTYISWPGYSDSSVLVVDPVNRTLNGQNCTCQMETDGNDTETATITLNVAYGPKGAVINGPEFHVTNGTQELTLSCEAEDMSPDALYSWITVDGCAHDKTCTFIPTLEEDGKEIFCTATNSVRKVTVTAKYTLRLKYPPDKPPMIEATDSKGGPLTSGDVLGCTVSGGKPLVQSVDFSCASPFLPDQDDVRDTTSVSSFVTINTAGAQGSLMVCKCLAIWGSGPELYQERVERTFNIDVPSNVKDENLGKTRALTFGVIAAIVLAAIAFIYLAATFVKNGHLFRRGTDPENPVLTDVSGQQDNTPQRRLSDVNCNAEGGTNPKSPNPASDDSIQPASGERQILSGGQDDNTPQRLSSLVQDNAEEDSDSENPVHMDKDPATSSTWGNMTAGQHDNTPQRPLSDVNCNVGGKTDPKCPNTTIDDFTYPTPSDTENMSHGQQDNTPQRPSFDVHCNAEDGPEQMTSSDDGGSGPLDVTE